MPEYRRSKTKGGCYFFTVVTYHRQRLLCREEVRSALRVAIRETQSILPFDIDAWVLLPDHLHCIWTLPSDDHDFSKRWAMIKREVIKRCKHLSRNESLMTQSKQERNEATFWQRRFWEHVIRDDNDYRKHVDYIHWNPVKHGLVSNIANWPYSTFHRYVKRGIYSMSWGGENVQQLKGKQFGE